MTTAADLVTVVGVTAAGAVGGALVAGTAGAVVGALVALVAGVAAAAARIRPFVAIAVAIGTAGGAVVGQGIVHALCLPGSCRRLEIVAATLTGLGAFVGVGLVVALVTRSFEEYREALDRERTPPPGRHTDDEP